MQVSVSGAPQEPSTGQLVLRNTLFLTMAQVVTVPLAILANGMTGHYLGPELFGYGYLAGTLCALGFLVVGWGHDSVLPAVVARDHSVAGTMLASSLVWRVATAFGIYSVLATACFFLGYPTELQWALALTAVFLLVTYLVAGCKDTIRGLERTDIPAFAHIAQQLLGTVFLAVALVLGGKLRAVLVAQSIAGALVLGVLLTKLRPLGILALTVRWDAIKSLFVGGTPFVAMGLAMALQPNIDAVFLSKLAPPEVLGWYAVSYRLLGTLLLPATALIGALYPTLCRLYATDFQAYKDATNGALRTVSLMVVPVALSCALFPELGVMLFSRSAFRPAEDNLRIMAIFLALVYISMPLAISFMAAGRQRTWSIVQCVCVTASVILDPLLITYFQTRVGNGGLGVCVAAVVAELLVLTSAAYLAPKGIFERIGRYLFIGAMAGVAMALVAWSARPLGPFIAAPLAWIAYVGALWLMGGIDKEQLATLRAALKLRREPVLPASVP